ncbi:MAG TPA: M20/M25/M40 family metallo-hydrolase, partial [Deinococcales bacterium]|nr:M20/M25/M40 family metallo-hydrolase [Deinococcales bacterium]
DLIAAVGKKAIHHMTPEDREKVSKIDTLWLDTGLNAEETRRRVPIGTVGVIEAPFVRAGEERIISKALDDRVGAFAVLEALRALSAAGCRHRVTAVATAQEEIGSLGARLAAVRERPTVAIAVDVGFETGQPGADAKAVGDAPFGCGAILSVSPLVNPVVLRRLQAAAAGRGIPTVLSSDPRRTSTDLDELTLAGEGAPGAVVSIPCRYMHSPSEMVDLRDVQAVADLLAAFVLDLSDDEAFER